ncbi:hypothetical protein O181_023775 [Austropuccinia psidii MF-1]|uniref:Uncharacterized protein n=1 Tax=Austropuccinia psidii MF-1 TaxID=1389203 RepID=A0A9Q3GZE9_9BASI|nr:hypothetical protein [Austropuccinia psidii MF-1]
MAKNFKTASGKMTSIGTILKEIIIPHRKGNIRLNPDFLVPDAAHFQGFLLGTDYQRMYGIDIYNSKNGHITIGTNKKKNFHLIYTKCLPRIHWKNYLMNSERASSALPSPVK